MLILFPCLMTECLRFFPSTPRNCSTPCGGRISTDLTDAIKTTVYSLRRKLGEGNGITSTRGKGYRLS